MNSSKHTEFAVLESTPTGGRAWSNDAEQRVVRQFAEALLFERLVAYRTAPRDSQGSAGAHFDEVYDLQVVFEIGEQAFRCLAAKRAFDRFRIAQGSVQELIDGQPHPCSLERLVTAQINEPKTADRVLRELKQTMELASWNRTHLIHQQKPRRGLGFQALESALVEGHLYHPSFKTRTGFTLQDHQDYGPEAGNTFQLQWLAVPRETMRIALPASDATFWQSELGPQAFARLTERLAQHGGNWDGHALLPIHPFQLQSLTAEGLDKAFPQGQLLRLGRAGDRYQATQSLRTLVNVSHPSRANVKLPLNITCTSVSRNLRNHFVCTGPMLSEWLSRVVANDAYLKETGHLLLLKEYGAMLYEPGPAPAQQRLEGKLGAIYRESVMAKLEPGQSAVPCTALMQLESDGRPFVAEWIDAHGLAPWLDRLVEILVIPLWHLLVHQGLAFESHMQNLILVHRDGWPERLVMRDFHDATEYVPSFLRHPEWEPDFVAFDPYFATLPEDDGYRMTEVEALRQLFMDTVYVFNLSDLAFLMERHFRLAPEAFWGAVQQRLRAYRDAGITEGWRIDAIDANKADIVVESLLKKKIMDGGELDFYEHPVTNALRD